MNKNFDFYVLARLKTQNFQKDQGYFDADYVATVYSYTTENAAIKAAERAKKDHKAVERYLKKTRKSCSRRLSM